MSYNVSVNLNVDFTKEDKKPECYNDTAHFHNYLTVCIAAYPYFRKRIDKYGQNLAIKDLSYIFEILYKRLDTSIDNY